MLSTNATLWPMIAHVVLVFFLYAMLSLRRSKASKAGEIQDSHQDSAESLAVNNNLKNQFELPVLFHACCVILYVSTADNIGTVVLSWIFVLSRYVHTYVQITSNELRYRRPAFMIGFAALVGMWVWQAVWLAAS